ncbi:hypothetical protein ES708_32653 [subsurface metagenome]
MTEEVNPNFSKTVAILKAQIKVVVEARTATAKAALEKNAAFQDWQIKTKGLLDKALEALAVQAQAEGKLRELTLQAFGETGNKAPVPGVGIRIKEKLEYDLKAALDWAKAHKMALSLDKKAFEKIAAASPETRPGFVTITEEPQATIATDLKVVE